MYVYVNWCEQKIISQEEVDELISKKAAEINRSMSDFDDWLNSNYDASEIWDSDEDWRGLVEKEWADFCYEEAEAEILRDYEAYSIN